MNNKQQKVVSKDINPLNKEDDKQKEKKGKSFSYEGQGIKKKRQNKKEMFINVLNDDVYMVSTTLSRGRLVIKKDKGASALYKQGLLDTEL